MKDNALPIADTASAEHSAKVAEFIANEIKNNGPISFCRFMELALYAPGLGYYSAGAHKFGHGGDFTTAPELSPIFSKCLANRCAAILNGRDILEFGAGTGVMAADILLTLEQKNCLPPNYFIVEVSADLRTRQKQTIEKKAPHLLKRVQWLDQLPTTPISAVVLANEVLDAMPVHRVMINDNTIKEYYVDFVEGKFAWQLQDSNITIPPLLREAENYTTEINLSLSAWFAALAQCTHDSSIILIDYGFLAHEFYHPQRHMGTLMCHFRHTAHGDPLQLIGIQDITTHVNFSDVISVAEANGFNVVSFNNQAKFLIDNGLIDFAGDIDSNQQIKTLTLPGEMGELFKVLELSHN